MIIKTMENILTKLMAKFLSKQSPEINLVNFKSLA